MSQSNAKTSVGKDIKVIFFDLLCTMPFYDALLVKHLMKINRSTLLAATTFIREASFFKKNGIPNGAKIVDIVSKINYPVDQLRVVSKFIEYIVNLLLLFIRFTVSRPDIIHIQWMPRILKVRFEIWFMKAVKMLGIKQVYTVHNILPHDTGKRYEKIFAEVYRMMDGIICHTHESKKLLVDEFGIPDSKTAVIPFGPMVHESTVSLNAGDARSMLNIPDNAVVVLAFGLIKPYKGTEYILKAWPSVVAANPDALLIIAGSGEGGYLNQLKDIIASSGIENSVWTHFKYLTDDELNIYHNAADILVYPYQNITQSAAIMTGMSFGKPIVASALEGFAEIIDHEKSGFLFPTGDTVKLAYYLNKLIASPEERERLGSNILDDIRNKFSWDSIARNTLKFYNYILEQ